MRPGAGRRALSWLEPAPASMPRLALALAPLALAPLAPAVLAQPAADPFRALVPADAEVEALADGFTWAEGPVWRPAHGDLLFSDVPENTAYRWADADGLSVFLRPSGLALDDGHAGDVGSNGLALDADGRLVLADHGTRAVTRLNPDSFVRTVLAAHYEGGRLNSPNDLVYHSSGALYFTDPPYGLAGQDADPAREQPVNGVYRLAPDGALTLLVGDLARPNGIAFSPDERTLYVANSDPAHAVWMAYPVREDGTVGEGRVLFDATAWVGDENPGLPDGLAVDAEGHLFATGPGGVLVLTPDGRHLGTIRTGKATANCAFGDDGRSLYMTAHDTLLRILLGTRGLGF